MDRVCANRSVLVEPGVDGSPASTLPHHHGNNGVEKNRRTWADIANLRLAQGIRFPGETTSVTPATLSRTIL